VSLFNTIKEVSFFIVIGFLIILFGINGCKKDSPCENPNCDSIPDCNPVYHYLTVNDLSFYNFIFQSDSIIYYKTDNSINIFNKPNILLRDTAGDCSNKYEYYSVTFLTSANASRIRYVIYPYVEIHFPQNFRINIGPFQQFGCESTFIISTGTDDPDLDSIQLLDKTFYNVYYRTDDFGCSSEMYYNKQYGVVGFNWQGEWYALETDSL